MVGLEHCGRSEGGPDTAGERATTEEAAAKVYVAHTAAANGLRVHRGLSRRRSLQRDVHTFIRRWRWPGTAMDIPPLSSASVYHRSTLPFLQIYIPLLCDTFTSAPLTIGHADLRPAHKSAPHVVRLLAVE